MDLYLRPHLLESLLGGLPAFVFSLRRGDLALLFGFLTRIAAFGIFVVMATAVALVHGKLGFFMNWFGQRPAGVEGFEYHILALALAFAVTIRGAGALSVDRSLAGGR